MTPNHNLKVQTSHGKFNLTKLWGVRGKKKKKNRNSFPNVPLLEHRNHEKSE
jgi:hypothetical protein